MADSDKAVPKKAALEKEVTPLGNARVQLKPAAKKSLKRDVEPTPAADEQAAEEPEDFDDDIEESSEAQAAPVPAATQPTPKPAAKKVKKAHPATVPKDLMKLAGVEYPPEYACVFKWQQIDVGRTYKAMSVGKTPRSRTGIVLVPLKKD